VGIDHVVAGAVAIQDDHGALDPVSGRGCDVDGPGDAAIALGVVPGADDGFWCHPAFLTALASNSTES
jgi:hypothetical protein